MRKVKILTDSCSDLDGNLLEKYDIDYARMNTVRSEKETSASLTWEHYTPHELYETMRNGERIKTTAVPPEEFRRVFTKYLDMGMDIVYISCSVRQSGSINVSQTVVAELAGKYSDASVFCVDSYNACLGEGMLAIRAAELRDRGMSAKEIADEIIRIRKTVNEYITVHTLNSLRQAGRVKASAAFFGNLLGVKPILIADVDGTQTPVKKVKGRQNSLNEIVALMKESIVDPENQTIYIVHADCLPEAEQLKSILQNEINCRDVYITYIGPIVGASIGPDAIGLFAFGKPVTFKAE